MIKLTGIWPNRPVLAAGGLLLLLVGAILLIIPGPGLVLLAAGLSVLGAEYAWARRQTRRLRDYLRRRGL
ncbi:MAG: PGPGW domain-containing protein [Pseudomonadota bacterium]